MARLTKAQQRELGKWSCAWCDYPLSDLGCGAIYGRCTMETRIKRRKRILGGKEDPDPFKQTQQHQEAPDRGQEE